MSTQLKVGGLVEHPSLGLGKIVWMDSSEARVYFKDPSRPDPDTRVRLFRLPSPFLSATAVEHDEELDNLPQWDGNRFVGTRTYDWETAKRIFWKHFSQGLGDTAFIAQEEQYKRSAHQRYVEARPQLDALIQQRDGGAIAELIDAIYGDKRALPGSESERLNLMYQRVEEPAFFDALRAGGDATVSYAQALIAWIDESSEQNFVRYVEALSSLPRRTNGAALDTWTTATWPNFIAAPHAHFLVKPTIVQAFAGLIPFEIQYRPDLNYTTYKRCVDMAKRLLRLLGDSELNPERRHLDLIDVQSFMWVVERYAG
jgi:hypothetical protein